MTDAAITISDDGTAFDLALSGADLSTEGGLRAAALVSLFTDRRADSGDPLPDRGDDRRGSWHDSYLPQPNDREGSRLWLLRRSKMTAETLARAQEYAEESLAWLLEDGRALAVSVSAFVVRTGVLGLRVQITLPDRTVFDDVFNYPLEA